MTDLTTVALEHHVWANLQLLDLCAELDEAQLTATATGVYGTVIDTLRHLVGADASYLALLTDGEVAEIDESTMDVVALRAEAASHVTAWRRLAADGRDPDEVITRHRDDGSSSGAPLAVRLAQVPHHGTDHRSQVCTILTALGVEPPEIDVWAWAWERDLLTETEPSD